MENYKILIVEDEGIQAMALEDTLTRSGYNIAGVVDNATDAQKVMANNAVDLVILDVNIKGELDGIETGRELKKQKDVAIVFLTAYVDSPTRSRAEEIKPDAFLTKPYRESKLLDVIESVLTNRNII